MTWYLLLHPRWRWWRWQFCWPLHTPGLGHMQKHSHCWGSSRRTGAGSLCLQRTQTKLGVTDGGSAHLEQPASSHSPNSAGVVSPTERLRAKWHSGEAHYPGTQMGPVHYCFQCYTRKTVQRLLQTWGAKAEESSSTWLIRRKQLGMWRNDPL